MASGYGRCPPPCFLKAVFAFMVVMGCLDRGYGGITSTFVRSEWPSIDIPIENEVFAVPKGDNVPQQVHITQGDYDGRAMIVSWVTPDEPGSRTVRFGKSSKKYDLSAEGSVTNYTFYKYKSGYIYHCLLEGLEHGTKSYYKIGNGESAREFWFTSPPRIDPDASYKFGIIGDLGQTYNSLSTLEHYMKSGASAVLFVGDLSYADRYQYNDVGIRWDTWGRFVESSTAFQPWIWSAGNHEMEYMPHMGEVMPFKSYLHRYDTPHLASASSSPLWYAIRHASAHITILSSYSPFVTSMDVVEGRVEKSEQGEDTLAYCPSSAAELMLFLLAMSMLMKDHIVFRTSNAMCEVAIAILSPISRHPSILLWEMVVTRKAWREGSRIRNQNILHFEKPAMDTLPWRL